MASTRPDDMGSAERYLDLAADPGTEAGAPAPALPEGLLSHPAVEATAATGRPEPQPGRSWGPVRRILFRFLCAYVVLSVLPFPFNVVPFGSAIGQAVQDFWEAVVPLVGWAVFGVDVPDFQFTGSGDMTFYYVQAFCWVLLAALATAVWTVLDRRRANYVRLHEWLRVLVRFSLAATMIGYGAAKVIPTQFPSPALDRMLQPLGSFSPMGLLWTFMGYSAAYTIFTGASEMLGGLLLTTRRTTTLGALVSIGVLSHVVMLNMSYDVPVKLFSLHLLGLSVFLLAPDLRRVARLLVLNRPVEAAPIGPLFRRKWLDRAALTLRTVLVVALVGYSLYSNHQAQKTYGSLAPKSPLRGIWEVTELTVDGEVRPPLITDELRWRRVVFDYPSFVRIQRMDDTRQGYGLKLDEAARTLALTRRDDRAWKSTLSYRRTAPGALTLEGTFDGHRIRALLRRTEESELLLLERGFRWINEVPFNR